MSKIICDVCGTSYPETATQCPICGCVRSSDTVSVAGDTSEALNAPSSYAYVKGGRFSKANVKKRNSGKPIYNAETVQKQTPRSGGGQGNQNSKNITAGRPAQSKKTAKPAAKKETPAGGPKKNETGLIVAIVVLLVAIAAVVIYIAVSFWGVDSENKTDKNNQSTTDTTQQVASTDNDTEPADQEIPCESLTVRPESIVLSSDNVSQQLEVSVLPVTTTDTLLFASDNAEIAEVNADGLVSFRGVSGTTKIIVTCGEKVAECLVVCEIDGQTTTDPSEGTEPNNPTTDYTEADLTFIDNGWGYEYTEPTSNKSYNPYNGNIPAELVQFTSSDESIATVAEDGTVTYLKAGDITITAKYGDWEITCRFIIY